MKFLLSICIILISQFSFAQNYFNGDFTYCTSTPEVTKSYNAGIKTLNLNRDLIPEYLAITTGMFLNAVEKDPGFCDAYFFTGYLLRLQNQPRECIAFYMMADSLSQNKSPEFKINLASASMMAGLLPLARKKYNEVIHYFPNNPEGYYGFALTSTIIGDTKEGLENIDKAMLQYRLTQQPVKNDAYLLKAILLTRNKRYEEALPLFEEVGSDFRKDDSYNSHYALSLLKVSQNKNDPKMLKDSVKHYKKIALKKNMTEELKNELAILEQIH